MARVFSITQGLENMGAMKTGGQGSVYKARKTGTLYSAIKILPTPIFSESNDDKNYTAFQNEVQKLQLVNQHPNPHVVNIISSGITDSGNFPYIEMEFIEGPDLEDLLKSPHEKIFTIKEVIKVAEQLSSALAHCHKLDVKHGDIKSNNVKFNNRTGNYVLLDFGLAALSDEQRRTSLRHAGAIEFMAPEQNEGELFFETDVYSFGIILYELLAGTVPFPLADKSESARNYVRLAHLESPMPSIQSFRNKAIQATGWSAEMKTRETQVPQWLIKMVETCLQKKPANRYANGMVLHNFIVNNSTQQNAPAAIGPVDHSDVVQQNKYLLTQKELLQKNLDQYKSLVESKDNDIDELKAILSRKDNELASMRNVQGKSVGSGISTGLIVIIILLAVGAFAAYTIISGNVSTKQDVAANETQKDGPVNTTDTLFKKTGFENNKPATKTVHQPAKKSDTALKVKQENTAADTPQNTNTETQPIEPTVVNQTPQTTNEPRPKSVGLFGVKDKAYFYSEPEESTRRNAFIVRSNNAVLAALNDKNDFIYVVYTNKDGQTSKGWLRKTDLMRLTQ